MREPFGGKYYGIWNVEGDGEPIVLFGNREDADADLARRHALPDDHDDRATPEHQVFTCDIAGAWWNSYDPDPLGERPMTLDEIVAAQDGDL